MTPAAPRDDRPGRGRRDRRRLVVAVVLAAMLVLAGVAALVARASRQHAPPPTTVEETRPVEIEGAPLPVLADSGADPAVGQRVPAVRGFTFDGRPVRIGDAGHAQVIVFLAHWCPHCQREVPGLVAWLKSGGLPAGVELYGVATATRPDQPNYPPSAWLAREEWPAPVLADSADGKAAHALGLSAFPFFVFTNARGEVVSRWAGELPIPDVEQRIQASTGPSPHAAR
jgi:cytochrome c biogenesis protein CcmG/thiol:disulfide interchange protein DsbE